jgi:predicted anti-sigma-YlaC factor YlaD
MLTCKDVAVMLSQEVDGELGLLNRAVLQTHLALCSTCRQIQRQFRLMEDALGEPRYFLVPEPLPDEARQRLKRSLRDAMDNPESG